ncbi:phosphate acetyltransferase [Candidatus Peregrinibacteria bacterium]|jgi:phosphate acetyltransferase|nr:phosphate acetyltransferase [Candidatus Peregrinibacteria bacterium]MBT4148077.1 phosphate acetyltransferase [Candidatus Peregrinibacteria bacterium]MBT4456469.1 phosphate acetyltransferase [Candidatus Peregrinibacteria bacterium]
MHNFLRKVRASAKANPKKIVFPEGEEPRILEATETIINQGFANPILIGDPRKMKSRAKKQNLKIDWGKVKIINPKTSKLTEKYTEAFAEARKGKGLTKAKARKILKSKEGINYFGTMMVHTDDADGMVSGTTFSTANTIRPALQIIKTEEQFHTVSGIFFMVLEKRLLLFADAAITIAPESHDLVDIAEDTVKTAKAFGVDPRVAFLSFSTKGSANHPRVDRVRQAVKMFKHEYPDVICDGEMQVDAALVPKVAEKKCPSSPIQGNANILVFPNLEAANISYKLVERLAGAKAIGPLLQGLRKPVNDLSRGCSAKDIVSVTAFTCCQAQGTCEYCVS